MKLILVVKGINSQVLRTVVVHAGNQEKEDEDEQCGRNGFLVDERQRRLFLSFAISIAQADCLHRELSDNAAFRDAFICKLCSTPKPQAAIRCVETLQQPLTTTNTTTSIKLIVNAHESTPVGYAW